jgi:nitroreductase
MNLNETIEKRHSVRKFLADPVPVDHLKEMVRHAGLAPSVNNAQPWQFIAVTNKDKIAEMAEIVHKKVQELFADSDKENVAKTVEYFSTVFEQAPAVILVAEEPYKAIADDIMDHEKINDMRRRPDIQSLGAAVENLLLSAVELGYGACWLSGLMVARPELEALFAIKAPLELMTAIAVGKPDGEPRKREKKPVDEIFQLID